jgi:hypothetical protein
LVYSEEILQNLHQLFDWQYIGQIIGGDFAKFCGLLRIYEFYLVMMLELFLESSNQISLISNIEKYFLVISNLPHNELFVIGLVTI